MLHPCQSSTIDSPTVKAGLDVTRLVCYHPKHLENFLGLIGPFVRSRPSLRFVTHLRHKVQRRILQTKSMHFQILMCGEKIL